MNYTAEQATAARDSRDSLARLIARQIVAGQTPWPSYVEEFAYLEDQLAAHYRSRDYVVPENPADAIDTDCCQ